MAKEVILSAEFSLEVTRTKQSRAEEALIVAAFFHVAVNFVGNAPHLIWHDFDANIIDNWIGIKFIILAPEIGSAGVGVASLGSGIVWL